MAKVYLITVVTPEGQIREVTFGPTEDYITVGKDGTIELNYSTVSRIHGQFIRTPYGVSYVDCHSTNGTTVIKNGRRIDLYKTDKLVYLNNGSFVEIIDSNKTPIIMLISEKGNQRWRSIAVTPDKEITIGRLPQSDIVLENPSVSRQQAVISTFHNRVILRDAQSTNGLFVNGSYVRGIKELHQNDIIQILNYTLIYSGGNLYYQSQTEGISLEIRDIVKVVGNNKVLLDHIDLDIESNDFVAIVGGSGAGKTTLFNAISGFDKQSQGSVCFNGIDIRQHFNELKSLIGYVPQEDIVYENLTLRRMLEYTSQLKSPKDTSKAEREKQIDTVLKQIDLTDHQNTLIKKLSGGQKKRASIAVELLGDPKLFFLDEPTSGLDPGNELNLMQQLKHLAKSEDKTVLIVTHSVQNLDLCDKVVFLGAGGKLCFCGPLFQAKEFFGTQDISKIYNIIAKDPDYWQKKYKQENLLQSFGQSTNDISTVKNHKQSISWFKQYSILLKRNLELLFNEKGKIFLTLLQPIVIGVCLYLVAESEIFEIYEPTKSLMFSMSCAAIWMGLFNSIQEICKERNILKREYMGGIALLPYIMAKFTVLVIIGLLQAFIVTTLFLGLIGTFESGIFFDNFYMEIFITVFITIIAATSLGLIVSSVSKSGDKAMTVAPFILIVQLLFSGILFKLEGITDLISFATISRWSVEALGSIVHLNDLEYRMMKDFPQIVHDAESIFEISKAHLLQSWGIMIGMIVICLLVSGLLLINLKNEIR